MPLDLNEFRHWHSLHEKSCYLYQKNFVKFHEYRIMILFVFPHFQGHHPQRHHMGQVDLWQGSEEFGGKLQVHRVGFGSSVSSSAGFCPLCHGSCGEECCCDRTSHLVVIAGTTNLVPCCVVKFLQLIWRWGTRRWNLRVPNLHMSCSDLT